MTIVGLHDFVKVSTSASLRSFLLIMCIDAPESTTNSLSSSFNVDAGRHLFSEGEKNVALSCSFNFHTFWPTSTLLRGHLAFATLSPPEIDPQILERWGCAEELHLGKYHRAKDFGLLDWLRHVGALPENRLRWRHVLKYATQLPCIR